QLCRANSDCRTWSNWFGYTLDHWAQELKCADDLEYPERHPAKQIPFHFRVAALGKHAVVSHSEAEPALPRRHDQSTGGHAERSGCRDEQQERFLGGDFRPAT